MLVIIRVSLTETPGSWGTLNPFIFFWTPKSETFSRLTAEWIFLDFFGSQKKVFDTLGKAFKGEVWSPKSAPRGGQIHIPVRGV